MDQNNSTSSPIHLFATTSTSDNINTLLYLVLIPTFTMLFGGILVFFVIPGPSLFSGMQHLAAGLLLGAILWEMSAELVHETHTELVSSCFGFIFGVGLLLILGRFNMRAACHFNNSKYYREDSYEEEPLTMDSLDNSEEGRNNNNNNNNHHHQNGTSEGKQLGNQKESYLPMSESDQDYENQTSASSWPVGLISAVWMNGLIDGLLIGIASVHTGSAGLITAIALGIEQGLLGITTMRSLIKVFSAQKALFITVLLIIPIPIAGMISGLYLQGVDPAIFAAINFFGVAGLLYLVTEELMIEAHEDELTDRWFVSFQTFVGFIIVISLHEFLQ